jgi:hypothetical protein
MRLDDLGALRVRVLGMEGGRMASRLRENKHVKNLFGHGRGPLERRRSDRIWLRCYEKGSSTFVPRSKCTATGRLLAKCRDLLA